VESVAREVSLRDPVQVCVRANAVCGAVAVAERASAGAVAWLWEERLWEGLEKKREWGARSVLWSIYLAGAPFHACSLGTRDA
jgi:hypothetical protein